MAAQRMLDATEKFLKAECGHCSAAMQPQPRRAEIISEPAPGIRKIMVAIEHDRHPALYAGISLAEKLGAQLAIITVADLSFATQAVYAYGSADTLDELRAFSIELLKNAQNAVPAKIPLECFNPNGNPGEQIISNAQAWDADLLVMGTHRRGNIAALLLGSTSRYVIRHAPCPVMLVPEDNSADH